MFLPPVGHWLDAQRWHSGVVSFLLILALSLSVAHAAPFTATNLNNRSVAALQQALGVAGGSMIYQEPNTAWQVVAVGDLNGDGKADLVWWNTQTGQVYGMLMNGDARVQEGMLYQEPDTHWRILTARDFDGDGKADLLWRHQGTGQVYLMLMNGLAIASGALIYHEPNLAWSIVAIGDLNHDGKADLIWRNNSTGQVYGMLMNGTAIGPQGMMYVEPNTAWQIVANGDYSGDGNADLLWRNSQTGQVYEMTMNGLTVTGGAQIYQEANTDWRILAKAKTKATQLPTQATAGVDYPSLAGEPLNPYQSLPDKLLNAPTAGLGQEDTRDAANSGAVKMTATALASAPIATLVQSGDFNGDGKADLIWQNIATGQVYGMLLNGFAITEQGMIYHEPNTAWRIVQNGDFTGDGQSELLWWNSSTGQVYLMTMVNPLTYTVTATAGANGSITPASQVVNAGATTTFTVTPNSSYTASVSGCGGTLSGTTYTTGAITAACTVTATFSQSGCGEGQIIQVNGVDRYRVVGSDCSIVADLVTGLEWQRCSVGQTWNASTQSCEGAHIELTWYQAMTQSAPGGFRLPTIEELRSLVYCSSTGQIGQYGSDECAGEYQIPTIVKEAFPNTSYRYWSSSTYASDADHLAWLVHFGRGFAAATSQDWILEVRLVRGGQSSASLPNASVTSQTSLSPPKAAPTLFSSELPPTLRSLISDAQASLSSPQASADGRVIVFATEAALLPEDNNGVSDIYRFTVAKGQLQRLSVSQDGQSANAASHSPRLDASGQRVVFLSAATNLTSGLPGTADQLYLHDEQIGGLLRLSETPSGEPADAAITHPLIDAAGQQVVYRSAAHNLADGPGLYRYDLRSGLRQPIAVDEQGQPDPRADVPAADAALALIAYQRPAANGLGAESTQVYLYDPAKSAALPVSEFFDGAGQSIAGCCASVSPEGGYLAWRETTAAGERRLILSERASGRRIAQPWPQAEALVEQAPVFRNDNRELWWVAPLQGLGSEPVLQRMQNPLMEAGR